MSVWIICRHYSRHSSSTWTLATFWLSLSHSFSVRYWGLNAEFYNMLYHGATRLLSFLMTILHLPFLVVLDFWSFPSLIVHYYLHSLAGYCAPYMKEATWFSWEGVFWLLWIQVFICTHDVITSTSEKRPWGRAGPESGSQGPVSFSSKGCPWVNHCPSLPPGSGHSKAQHSDYIKYCTMDRFSTLVPAGSNDGCVLQCSAVNWVPCHFGY
jgi:hypothetical protein